MDGQDADTKPRDQNPHHLGKIRAGAAQVMPQPVAVAKRDHGFGRVPFGTAGKTHIALVAQVRQGDILASV